MHFLLHVIRDGPIGATLRFAPGRYLFGRSEECHVRIFRRAVSRRHCLLTVGPDRAAVRDLGSRNHTLVNFRPVTDEQPLRHGDRLSLCGTELRAQFVADEAAQGLEWMTVRLDAPGYTLDQPEESGHGPAINSGVASVTIGPAVGELAPGRYELPLNIPGYDLSLHVDLRAQLGHGRFGQVWWAKTRGTGPDWHDEALKVGHHPDGSAMAHLCRCGAMAVATLPKHPHVLGPKLIGSFAGRPLVATALADNSLEDLAGVLTRADLMPRLLAAVRDAAAGLDHLHAHGIVHGCPKPADILLVRGRAAVADWDLAHPAHSAEGVRATARHGDPEYLAPEVWDGFVSGPSDQYALACGYARLRTGRPVFPVGRRDVWELCHRSFDPDLTGFPNRERAVIERALAREPDRRFTSCGEFASALGAVAGSKGGSR